MIRDPNPEKMFYTQEDAIRFFCRHLVSLSGWYQIINSKGMPTNEPQFFSYSGFIIVIKGEWNLVTAGHNLSSLETLLKKKRIKINKFALVDHFGPSANSQHPIPFNYEDAPKLFIDDENLGLDFGLIILRPYYQNLLKANGIIPIIEENWKNIPADLLDKHLMVGLPQKFIKIRTVGKKEKPQIISSASPAGIGVERINKLPDGVKLTEYPRFIGQLSQQGYSIDDIDGMSGGPIFGFNKEWNKYWVVAIQSRWLPESRITFGCLVSVFAQLVDDWLDKLKP